MSAVANLLEPAVVDFKEINITGLTDFSRVAVIPCACCVCFLELVDAAVVGYGITGLVSLRSGERLCSTGTLVTVEVQVLKVNTELCSHKSVIIFSRFWPSMFSRSSPQ